MQHVGWYKPVLNIVIVFFLSWAISFTCSLALKGIAFELSLEESVSISSGDYILFLSGDNKENLIKLKNELEEISFLKDGENFVNLSVNKKAGLSFPVRVGIGHIESVGEIQIATEGEYQLKSDLSQNHLCYSLADNHSFTLAYGIVMVVGVVSSLVLLAVFVINFFKIPIVYKIWKLIGGNKRVK